MDIKSLNEEQILELLSRGEQIPYYPDISSLESRAGMQVFPDIMSEEDKLSRALSRGISEQKGFKGSTKIPDIVKELSMDMGVDTPDIQFKYDPKILGSADLDRNIITLNPAGLSDIGRESVIAHELRHLKEGSRNIKDNPLTWDKSIRNTLYTATPETGNPLLDLKLGLMKSIEGDAANLAEQGKSLGYYQKIRDRLFPNDKLKYKIDALDAYDFLEKGHFEKPFLKTNLQRVAKGLPIIGAAATVVGGLGYSDLAGAATDFVVPGGVSEMGVSPEQAELDRRYKDRIRELQSRKLP